MRDFKEYTIYNSVTPQTVTSSTDASPAVVTKNNHGLATGDRVIIYGHATNVAINGVWDVVKVNDNTFTLKNINTGAAVNGSGAGAGSGGIMAVAPKIPLASDFTTAIISFVTAGTATLTAKVAGSIGKLSADESGGHGDAPNFGATLSDTNTYTFLDIVDLDTNDVIAGATGIVASGTDLVKQYQINCSGMKYLTLIPTAWTQGAITAKLQLFTNN